MAELKLTRRYWRRQLWLTLIFLSLGPLLIGVGILIPSFPDPCPGVEEITFNERVQGELTSAQPNITRHLGFCDRIIISPRNQEPYTIHILGEYGISHANLSTPTEMLNTTLEFSLWLFPDNYMLNVERQATDVTISLRVTATVRIPCPPYGPSYLLYLYQFNICLIVLGITCTLIGAYYASKLTQLLDQL